MHADSNKKPNNNGNSCGSHLNRDGMVLDGMHAGLRYFLHYSNGVFSMMAMQRLQKGLDIQLAMTSMPIVWFANPDGAIGMGYILLFHTIFFQV